MTIWLRVENLRWGSCTEACEGGVEERKRGARRPVEPVWNPSPGVNERLLGRWWFHFLDFHHHLADKSINWWL